MATATAVTADAAPRANGKRRWLQFSLRTSLVLMLLCGSGLGWLGREFQRARAQREAARALEKLGGRVLYTPVPGARVRTAVVWLGRWLGEDLRHEATKVSLDGTQVSDAGLVHLRGLPRLALLDLVRTQVSDAGLVHLPGLPQLQVLSLAGTQAAMRGWCIFADCRNSKCCSSPAPRSATRGWHISVDCRNC